MATEGGRGLPQGEAVRDCLSGTRGHDPAIAECRRVVFLLQIHSGVLMDKRF